jgi:hypothetical protein
VRLQPVDLEALETYHLLTNNFGCGRQSQEQMRHTPGVSRLAQSGLRDPSDYLLIDSPVVLGNGRFNFTKKSEVLKTDDDASLGSSVEESFGRGISWLGSGLFLRLFIVSHTS